MKNTKKGLTLVEVLVSISVFTIIIFALFTTILAMRKVVSRQEEYVRIKMACGDMQVYYDEYDEYNDGWYSIYFGGNIENDTGYLTSDFKPTATYSEGCYIVEFEGNTIKEIRSPNGKILINNLQLPLGEEDNDEKEQN